LLYQPLERAIPRLRQRNLAWLKCAEAADCRKNANMP
jgi:hypothetical protein